jgi:hypothetical protein
LQWTSCVTKTTARGFNFLWISYRRHCLAWKLPRQGNKPEINFQKQYLDCGHELWRQWPCKCLLTFQKNICHNLRTEVRCSEAWVTTYDRIITWKITTVKISNRITKESSFLWDYPQYSYYASFHYHIPREWNGFIWLRIGTRPWRFWEIPEYLSDCWLLKHWAPWCYSASLPVCCANRIMNTRLHRRLNSKVNWTQWSSCKVAEAVCSNLYRNNRYPYSDASWNSQAPLGRGRGSTSLKPQTLLSSGFPILHSTHYVTICRHMMQLKAKRTGTTARVIKLKDWRKYAY